ncbi:hypothetical protein K493DRAFT_307514 [Basidiobolus meristosporus CBS 931.73]|uniref:Uncharacterized protein n=1 Tax=Basidiobolus meristosporus CBS 931.73 TaxID=1314790 RepID=A0A1Y1XE33_9FUNG|nr:hypothetical protein K493DRAFT_307514 [Basidiobolus meristosporus CBS 931.73]|eukprot:ORX83999.1 hypothetical protein K493DRAFT_307514 [Basidiobolus meristosporus CBS 931.73]
MRLVYLQLTLLSVVVATPIDQVVFGLKKSTQHEPMGSVLPSVKAPETKGTSWKMQESQGPTEAECHGMDDVPIMGFPRGRMAEQSPNFLVREIRAEPDVFDQSGMTGFWEPTILASPFGKAIGAVSGIEFIPEFPMGLVDMAQNMFSSIPPLSSMDVPTALPRLHRLGMGILGNYKLPVMPSVPR